MSTLSATVDSPASGSAPHHRWLVLHGLLADASHMQKLVKELRALYPQDEFVSLDLPSHGQSPATADLSLDSVVEAVAQTVDLSQFDVVLGHSWGGRVGLRMRKRYLWTGPLVVLDITPYGSGAVTDLLRSAAALDLPGLQSRKEAQSQLEQQGFSVSESQFVLRHLSRAEDKTWRWRMPIPEIAESVDQMLDWSEQGIKDTPPQTVAMLLVKGKQSLYCKAEWIAAMEEELAPVQIAQIDSGHWLHWDSAPEVADAVHRYLSELADYDT